MKNVIALIVLVFFTHNAMAISGTDSWSSIRESRDVLIRQPEFAKIFGPNGLFNACHTKTQLRSQSDDVFINRDDLHRTSFELVVLEAEGEEAGAHLFSKSFAVPECESF